MSQPNYVFEAFKLKGNVIALAGGVIAAAVLSSGFVLGVVVGAETLYLLGMSTNHRFRRAIRSLQR
jgi:hypothetical protein